MLPKGLEGEGVLAGEEGEADEEEEGNDDGELEEVDAGVVVVDAEVDLFPSFF